MSIPHVVVVLKLHRENSPPHTHVIMVSFDLNFRRHGGEP